MSFFSKMFLMGMCGVGLMLASSSDAEAGRRHRNRHHGGDGGCHSAPTSCCGQTYAAPVSNGCCTTDGSMAYGKTGAYGGTNHGGHATPMMAPSGSGNSSSPSDMPANSQPPAPPAPGNAVPPPPAAQ